VKKILGVENYYQTYPDNIKQRVGALGVGASE